MLSEEEFEASKIREIRDIFAACALMGMLANSGYHFDGSDDDTDRAAQAYSFAEAMLEERSRRNQCKQENYNLAKG